MRENIGVYRGKVKGGGAWLCGYLSRRTICTDNRAYLGYAIQPKPQRTTEACRCVWHEVDENTIGENTDVQDKEGKDIFEWDIVESRASENPEDWKRWVVVWQDGGFEFTREVSHRKKHKHEINSICRDEVEFFGLVVIGNIVDSPELLKERD